MKDYYEQNYKVSVKVRVTTEYETFEDEHKGLNEGHALYLARRNWEGSVVELIK